MVDFVVSLSRVTPSAFQHPIDDSGEFEVEDVLDSCFLCLGY